MDEVDSQGKGINMKLFGSTENDDHRTIEIIYKPCKPLSQEFARNSSCIMDDSANKTALTKRLQTIKQWLAHPELILVYNEEVPNLEYYDDKRIS